MSLDVFFSYDSDDRLVVYRIRDGIEARAGEEIDIYVYEEDLQPGANIPTKAKSRIKGADLFLVLITQNSQGSAWVQQEVGFANGVGCEVVPILLDASGRPELKGLLGGKEYLTFDRERPGDFFEDFLDYAVESLGVDLDGGEGPSEGKPRKGHLSTLDSSRKDEHIIIESPVEVYRREDNRHEVVAETAGQVVRLGLQDASVSRKKEGAAPIVFEPSGEGQVTIHNIGSTNPITVKHGVGVEPSTVSVGESLTLGDTCTVNIGFNTRLKLGFRHDTIDMEKLASTQPGVEKEGAVVRGVPPAMYVREVTDNLLTQAEHGSVADCLKISRKLHSFVDEHSVSASEYDEVCDRLEDLVNQLDAELSGSSRPGWPNSEWIEQIDLVADQLERLYARDAGEQTK